MPRRLFDELAVARFAEIVEDGELPRVLRRLRSSKSAVGGNFGGFAIREALGLEPMKDFKATMRAARLARAHATTVRCPECKARKGVYCLTGSLRRRRAPHLRRVEARDRAEERDMERIRARQVAAS